MRRWTTAIPYLCILALAVALAFSILQGLQNGSDIDKIKGVVYSATCGGGHDTPNFQACQRLCPNLESISNLRCLHDVPPTPARP